MIKTGRCQQRFGTGIVLCRSQSDLLLVEKSHQNLEEFIVKSYQEKMHR